MSIFQMSLCEIMVTIEFLGSSATAGQTSRLVDQIRNLGEDDLIRLSNDYVSMIIPGLYTDISEMMGEKGIC